MEIKFAFINYNKLHFKLHSIKRVWYFEFWAHNYAEINCDGFLTLWQLLAHKLAKLLRVYVPWFRSYKMSQIKVAYVLLQNTFFRVLLQNIHVVWLFPAFTKQNNTKNETRSTNIHKIVHMITIAYKSFETAEARACLIMGRAEILRSCCSCRSWHLIARRTVSENFLFMIT